MLAGRITSRAALRLIREWAALHGQELEANWRRIEVGLPVEEIAPLRDPAYFRRFFVDAEMVAWPNGADIAPETLYEAARATLRGRSVNNGSAKQ